MNESIEQMREFIALTEQCLFIQETEPDTTMEAAAPVTNPVIISELQDIVFRLRAFMESAGGEYALGVETGMQRAADMIDNVIRRHTEGE